MRPFTQISLCKEKSRLRQASSQQRITVSYRESTSYCWQKKEKQRADSTQGWPISRSNLFIGENDSINTESKPKRPSKTRKIIKV